MNDEFCCTFHIGDGRGGDELHALEAVLLPGNGRQHRRQPAVAVRIDQQVELAFGEVARLDDDHSQQVSGERDRLAEEVAPVHHLVVTDEMGWAVIPTAFNRRPNHRPPAR